MLMQDLTESPVTLFGVMEQDSGGWLSLWWVYAQARRHLLDRKRDACATLWIASETLAPLLERSFLFWAVWCFFSFRLK